LSPTEWGVPTTTLHFLWDMCRRPRRRFRALRTKTGCFSSPGSMATRRGGLRTRGGPSADTAEQRQNRPPYRSPNKAVDIRPATEPSPNWLGLRLASCRPDLESAWAPPLAVFGLFGVGFLGQAPSFFSFTQIPSRLSDSYETAIGKQIFRL